MTRAFTWAAGSVAMTLGLLSSQGCLIKVNNGETGGGAATSTGSDTSGNTTATGAYTTGSSMSTASGVIATSCDADAADDTCTACSKKSCCVELEACNADAGCAATYGVYSECLFPGGNDPSGYTTTYCQAVAGEQSPAGKKSADALITCLTTTCGNDTACGTPEKVTWDNFAAEFSENFCNGCHFPGFSGWNAKGESKQVGPGAADIPRFSDDDTWASWGGGPQGNPDWKTPGIGANFKDVSAVAKRIWCGVSVQLPAECNASEFPNAERFPPPGVDLNVTLGPSCEWTSDGSCPQPTDVERNKMSSWVFDGTPQN